LKVLTNSSLLIIAYSPSWSIGNLDEIFKEMVAKHEKLSSCERNQK